MRMLVSCIIIVLAIAGILWAFDTAPFREVLKNTITLTTFAAIALIVIMVVLSVVVLIIGWIFDNGLQKVYGMGIICFVLAVMVPVASKFIPADMTLLGYPPVTVLNVIVCIAIAAWIIVSLKHIFYDRYL